MTYLQRHTFNEQLTEKKSSQRHMFNEQLTIEKSLLYTICLLALING